MNEIKYQGANTRRRIWLIAPGKEAEYWNICIDKGIICIGWKEAAEDLKEKLIEIQDRDTFRKEMTKFGYSDQDISQLWKFLKEVSNGDIVLAKKGAKKNRSWCNKIWPQNRSEIRGLPNIQRGGVV